jgi:hypothetical protein
VQVTVTDAGEDVELFCEEFLPKLYRPRRSLVAKLAKLVRHVFTAAGCHCYVCGRVVPPSVPGAVSRVCANDLCQFHVVETPNYWCDAHGRAPPLPRTRARDAAG